MKKNILITFLILFVTLFILAFIMLRLSQPIQQNVVEAHVIVDEGIGFNLESDKLYFGRMPPGGSSTRDVNISSPNDVILVVSTKGEIANWIHLSTNTFFIEGSTAEKIPFSITVPEDASFGNHTANITFTLYRPFMKHFIFVATDDEKNKTFK